MAEKIEVEFTVQASDCQPDGRIKPYALMQCLQEAAACHAEKLGVGFADLKRRNGFWVLANMRLEIARLPRWNERLAVKTWPSGFTRLVATREFIGAVEDGGEIFRAASEWMILDKQSGRPKNLTRLELDLPAAGPKALTSDLRRLRPSGAYETALTLRVPYSALDLNGHVNNTEYVRWAFDALHERGLPKAPVRSLQMAYLAEAFQGDEIVVLVRSHDDQSVQVVQRRTQETLDVFAMDVTC
jgi:acyl-ACP thioesterase